jgi:signal transduction histidine kinase
MNPPRSMARTQAHLERSFNGATLTKLQARAVRLCAALTVAETISTAADTASKADERARRTRSLMAVARARIANTWLRIAACAIVAVVATSVVGNYWPAVWWLGLIPVVLIDSHLYKRLYAQCEAGDPPHKINTLIAWTTLQSAYGNYIAAVLWFAPYVPGETLSILYICGGLANAGATLRSSTALTMAGLGPTIVTLLGLPLAEFVMKGGQNSIELLPLVGGLLLIGFGINLWKSLLASDAAQAQAEAAAMRERQAAAAAAAAKSHMIQRMNDELRTPMTALIGAAEHLRRAAATPQARAHIATLAQAGEVLKLVLDDLSDLDRLENSKLRIEAKPTDPRDVVRSVVSAFRAAAQDKNLELFLDVAADTPALVAIDAARVRQVLFNLLANAVRYTHHGGVRIRVTAQPTSADRVRLCFIVADTGAGMSRTQLAKIFGREKLCADGEGPGLGLSISIRLAKLMGGQIQAKSELGQGSVFQFALDAAVAAAPARSNSAA